MRKLALLYMILLGISCSVHGMDNESEKKATTSNAEIYGALLSVKIKLGLCNKLGLTPQAVIKYIGEQEKLQSLDTEWLTVKQILEDKGDKAPLWKKLYGEVSTNCQAGGSSSHIVNLLTYSDIKDGRCRLYPLINYESGTQATSTRGRRCVCASQGGLLANHVVTALYKRAVAEVDTTRVEEITGDNPYTWSYCILREGNIQKVILCTKEPQVSTGPTELPRKTCTPKKIVPSEPSLYKKIAPWIGGFGSACLFMAAMRQSRGPLLYTGSATALTGFALSFVR